MSIMSIIASWHHGIALRGLFRAAAAAPPARPGPAQPGGMTRNRTPKKLSDNPLVNAITTLPMPERHGTSGR